ncbi:unnamed protein product [marine sediment metagenome]|uniref:Flagellar assembly protein FliH/Type III secretion system HrpE domain-containing protein n=1 Tax=marine sediment metagenome TaxID=412755 RepID=X0TVH5_9ZZZZ
MSTIIKAAAQSASGSSQTIQRVAFNLDDIAVQADRYMETVREQAAQILGAAEAEAEQVRQRAAEEGRQAAMQAVEKVLDEKVASQMKTLLPALQRMIQEVEHSREAWLAHWQKSAVRVAVAIAGRVIRREVTATPQIAVELIKEALELAAGSADISLHMHPTDHENLGPQAQRLAAEICQLSPAEVIADPKISLGGCRVETKFGAIDQQFEAQLERIVEELTA